MGSVTKVDGPGFSVPYLDADGALFDVVRSQVTCDRFALGVIHFNRPCPDELLAADGYAPEALRHWCDGGFQNDELLALARRRGAVCASDVKADESGALDAGGSAAACVAPESATKRMGWWLRAWRAHGGFDGREREAALLALKQIQARFNQPDEPAMGRLLLGHDLRLIHSDPYTASRLLRHRREFGEIVAALKTVATQRWPDMGVGEGHDIVISCDGRSLWLRFWRRAVLADADADHWYVEIRPAEGDELPAVGAIDDDRIARAVAYIHDRYDRAPSLPEIAGVARISAFHFHRLFSRNIGVSPKHYLQARQMQIARWLLRTTRMPVGDIARHAGYASHGHFTSTFHRLTGVSPTEYRERG